LEQATCEVAGFRREFRKEGMMPSPAKELPAWSTAYPLNPQPRSRHCTVKRPESIDSFAIMAVVDNGERETMTTQTGFDPELETRFQKVYEQIAEVATDVHGLGKDLKEFKAEVNEQFDQVNAKFDQVNTKLDILLATQVANGQGEKDGEPEIETAPADEGRVPAPAEPS
jgi:hypothetical protein